jgi:hypothetical protein
MPGGRLLFAVRDFGATFILPTALPAKTGEAPKTPAICIQYLYYSGIFRDFQGHLKGFSGQ